MAFHLRDEQDDVMGDINVTPLVDVMLELLIIFMVATPMLHQGIQVALPRADARNLPLKVQDPIVLSINRDGDVFLRDARVPLSELADRIKDRLAGRPGAPALLQRKRGGPPRPAAGARGRLSRSGPPHRRTRVRRAPARA